MRRATAFLGTFVVLVLVVGKSVSADVIAADGFVVGDGGYATGNITGQNPTVTGFTGAWSTNTATIGVVATGLEYPGVNSEGGTARFTHTGDLSDNPRQAYRSLGSYDDTQDAYYFSGLMSFDANFATDTDGYARMGFVSGTSDDDDTSVFGVQWGFQGNGDGGVDAFVRVRDYLGGTAMNEYTIAEDIAVGTHLFVVKLQPNSSGGSDAMSIWLDPADVSSEAAAGDATWSQSTLAWVPSDDPGFSTGYLVDMLVLKSFSVGANAVVGYDEARMGTAWDDGVSVPEPGSMILGLAGLVSVLVWPRLRRRLV